MEPIDFQTMGTSRKEIEWYLLTWLKPNENPTEFVISGKKYHQIMGFRRGFCIHVVLREVNGDSYAFHVSESVPNEDYQQFVPNMGVYQSFAELLTGVTGLYFRRWNSLKVNTDE